MIPSFFDYMKHREWYGGEPGAESMASVQADGFGLPTRTTAMPQYGDSDKPPTKKVKRVKRRRIGKIKY